jgi:hypothetical protein
LDAVPGWFFPTDQKLFQWFLAAQIGNQSGDLAELGVYLGKSAIWTGYFVQPGEIFTAVDLFSDAAEQTANRSENADQYSRVSQTQFERNYRSFHRSLPAIVRGESHSVAEHATHGTHRWVHVDASHLYDNVAKDVDVAKVLLQTEGIVVFDDIRAAHTPGVWAAVWEAVITKGLRPIVVTECKFYGTWGSAEAWQERLLGELPEGVEFEEQHVLGQRLLRVWTEAAAPSWRSRLAGQLAPPAARSAVRQLKALWGR